MGIQVESKWEELIRYIGLKDEHLELLHKHKDYFENHAQEVVMNFYTKVVMNESMSAIVLECSTFERLSKTQTAYFKHLFSRNIDSLYIMYVERIGHAHHRIGLKPEWYLAGVNVYLDEVYTLCKDLEDGFAIFNAFTKRIMFDTQVCLVQYDLLKEEAML